MFVNELWSRRNETTSGPAPTHPLLRSDSDDTNTATGYGVIDSNRPAVKPQQTNDDADQHDTDTAASHYVDPSRFRGVKVKYVKPKAKPGAETATRSRCACQAREHQLYTNCTACGKIVCVVEGEGECFYCSSYVTKQHTTAADAFVQQMQQMTAAAYKRSNVGKGEAKTREEDEAATAAGLARAEQQKQKLLDFSAANVARSRVLDQQSDYFEFESNKWLTEDVRKARMAEAKKEEEKLDRRRHHTVSIDLVKGEVIAHSSDPLADENRGRGLKSDGVEIVTREDEERQRQSAATTASSGGSGTGALNIRRSGVAHAGVNAMVEEMKTVSARQYYSNDTLTGKARLVYEQMQAAMELEDKERDEEQKRQPRPPKRTLFTSRVVHDDDIEHSTFDQDELGVSSSQSLWSNISDEQQLPPTDSFQPIADDEPDCRVTPASIVPSSSSSSSVPFSDSSDTGTTLSMHQPWASLLVLGIKRFEGRGWSTSYRGRLWIASTAHQSTDEENKQLEDDYRAVYGPDKHIPFPASYPHSALLGCVDLVDVVDQAAFQRLRAERGEREDSASAFVFVCERPRVLSLPVSISGQHKLWQLSRAMVEGVQRQLVEVSERWRTGKVKKKEDESAGNGGAKRKTLTVVQKKKGPRMPNEA